jgi:major intracellular serine protease
VIKIEPRILSLATRQSDIIKNYAMEIMRFNLLWKQGYTGKGMVVGVVDSGIDYNHEMLKDKVVDGYNFSDDGKPYNDIFDYNYHGTSVSALICGDYMDYRRYGIAPESKVIVAKCMNTSGKGDFSAITNAINYCVNKNVDVINCSIGCAVNSYDMENAVRNAVKKGIPVVVSSGNEGRGDVNGAIREISYPAAYDDSISVGAMDRNFNIASFSNSNEFVDFIAPGVQMLTAYPNNQYALVEGTSFAAPLISGSLILLKQKFINDFKRVPSETELYGLLMKFTRELQDINKQMQGHGYIDFSINRKKRR